MLNVYVRALHQGGLGQIACLPLSNVWGDALFIFNIGVSCTDLLDLQGYPKISRLDFFFTGDGPRAEQARDMRGIAVMWDEAVQRCRAPDRAAFSNAPRIVQTMVTLSAIYNISLQGDSEKWEWQPWLCPLLYMTDTKHMRLLNGLARVMPYDWSKPDSIAAFAAGVKFLFLGLVFDMASSNVSAFGRMLHVLESNASKLPGVALHGERCLVHQMHITKNAALNLKKAAGMMYSLTCTLPAANAAKGLLQAIRNHVKSRLVIRYSAPPPFNEAKDIVALIYQWDDDDPVFGSRTAPKRASLAMDLQRMFDRCHYDRQHDKWLYFVQPLADGTWPETDLEQAVDFVAGPLQDVCVKRRWAKAALSRWTVLCPASRGS